jgi:hypothetical protein
MDLQDGATYRSPDGTLYKAKLEYRRYAPEPAWVLVSHHLDAMDSWRDSLEQLLFVENGRIGTFSLSGSSPRFVDTGWDLSEFTLAEPRNESGEKAVLRLNIASGVDRVGR